MSFPVSQRASEIGMSPIRRIFEAAPPGSVHLGLGQPTERTPEPILEMARQALAEDPLGYTPNAGLPALRAAVAESYGGGFGPEQVCITAGSQEALYSATQALLDPGDEMLLPDPGFLAYPTVARLAGAVPVPYPLDRKDGFRLHLEAIAERIGPRTRAVLICTPSNPLGTVIDKPTLAGLGALCEERGLYLLSDEVYRELYYTPEPPPSAAHFCGRAVVIQALSKSHAMTGWRLGWTLAPRPAAERIILVHAYVMTCTAALVQHTALRLFRSGRMGELAAEGRARYRRRRDLLLGLLGRHGLSCIRPEGTFYAFADVSGAGQSSEEVAWGALHNEKVVTIPGSVFGPGGEGYLRLSFAATDAELEEGIGRLARYLRPAAKL
jgi:aspartate/methionine/tyrosine aminotransferase